MKEMRLEDEARGETGEKERGRRSEAKARAVDEGFV
jgi:hypothetical protein